MRVFPLAVVALLVLTAVPAQAEAPFGELYFGAGSQGTTSSTHPVLTADEIPAAGKAYFPISSMGGTYTTNYRFTAPYEFSAGVIEFHFKVGCESFGLAAPAQANKMRIDVVDGSNVVADLYPAIDYLCVDETLDVTGSVDLGGHVFAAGNTIDIDILAWFSNPYHSSAGMYFVTGPEPAISGFGLPVGLAAPVLDLGLPATTYENLTSPMVSHLFNSTTNDTYVFNFTTENGFGIVELDVNGTGFANATLTDAVGVELFNGTLANGLTEYQNFTAGNWTLTLAYDNFNGTLDFAFLDGESVQADVPEGSEDQMENDNNATTNETLDGVGDDNQEAPGVALPLLLAGLVALVRRRK